MTESQFTPMQEASISDARAAMRTTPEAMDKQAYLTLDLYARNLRLQLILHEQFLQHQGRTEAYQEWLKHR